MTGSEFYDTFKQGLRALDLEWREMDQADVTVEDSAVVFRHGKLAFVVDFREEPEGE